MDSTNSLEVGSIVIGLLGGLALFLYGMDKMTEALKIVAGGGMKSLLARLTTNRFTGVLAGTVVTAIIQSSSVTTVLVVGFISAGLMTLEQSIPVMLGADIGTTITAQIVAFNVTKYGLVLVSIGFLMQFVIKRETIKQYGVMIMGLGMIFFGMELMSNATEPLRTYVPFIALMHQMDNPIIGIIVGTIFTAIIQSSSATMGIIIVLASQGFVSLEAGIALALGANIGTTITAVLASIGKPREAVQAAVVHVFFKVAGVLIWFPLIYYLANFTRTISPGAPELEGVARLAAETPRQIANAYTLFNVANTLIFIWFVNPIAAFMRWLIPEKPITAPERVRAIYLDDILLDTPDLALDRTRLELGWLGAHMLQMVQKALPVVVHGTRQELTALAEIDDDVDTLYSDIVKYLGKLSQRSLLASQSNQVHNYMTIANYIESIGDMIETNLVEAGKERLQQGLVISASTQEHLQALHEKVFWTVERSLLALAASDKQIAESVLTAKGEVNRLTGLAENHIALRLVVNEPNRFEAFRIESEIVEYLKRVYYFAKRIAKMVDGEVNQKREETSMTPPSATHQLVFEAEKELT